MISGRNKILGFFEDAARPYFKVYKRGTVQSGNPVFENQETDDITVAVGFQAFEKWLSYQSTGQFTLILSDKSKPGSKGKLVQDFDIPLSEATPQQAAPAIAGFAGFSDPGVNESLIQKKASEMLETHLLKWENGKLITENAELKREVKNLEKNSGGFAAGIEKIMPHIGSILGAFKGTPAAAVHSTALAGISDDLGNDAVLEARVGAVLAKFAKHDADWLTTLEKMAAKLEQTPAMLSMLKSMLG